MSSNNIQGRVDIILGCMFSGKSTELLRRTNTYKAIGKNILLINHTFDNRTELNVKTNSNQKEKALKSDKLLPILKTEDFKNADVVGIDEAQFFPDLLQFIKESEKFNKIIIVVGLDGDYKREKIGQILDIIPYCDTVVKLAAMDMIDKDGSPGIFSKRIVENNEKILIGANDTYLAVSWKNFNK